MLEPALCSQGLLGGCWSQVWGPGGPECCVCLSPEHVDVASSAVPASRAWTFPQPHSRALCPLGQLGPGSLPFAFWVA